MTSGNADSDFKLRMHRLLWNQGYLARREIILSSFLTNGREPLREDITDIDVLGMRYDENLKPEYVICDCKTDKKSTSINRTFWTRGVMELFGAKKGYVITYKSTRISKVIAPDFNIIVLNDESLTNFEKSMKIDKDEWIGSYNKYLDETIDGYKKEIKIKYFKEFFYYKYRYWLDQPNEQLKRLISLGKQFNKIDDYSDVEKWFLHEIIILFSISILSFSSKFIAINESNLIDSIVTEWHGNAIDKAHRKNLMQSVHKFIKEYLESECNKKITLKLDQFNTEPDYVYTSLTDTVLRLLKDTDSSRNISRFIDFFTYTFCVPMKPIDKNLLVSRFNVSSDIPKSVKLAKDIIKLFCDATQINPIVFKDIIEFNI